MRRAAFVSVFLVVFAAPLLRAQTQHEMHVEADLEARAADAELARVRAQFVRYLSDEELTDLERADRAFAAYRDAEVEFLVREWDGGSVLPMMACSERAAITRDRAEHLAVSLDYRKLRYSPRAK